MAYNSQHWDWGRTEICVKFSKEWKDDFPRSSIEIFITIN